MWEIVWFLSWTHRNVIINTSALYFVLLRSYLSEAGLVIRSACALEVRVRSDNECFYTSEDAQFIWATAVTSEIIPRCEQVSLKRNPSHWNLELPGIFCLGETRRILPEKMCDWKKRKRKQCIQAMANRAETKNMCLPGRSLVLCRRHREQDN